MNSSPGAASTTRLPIVMVNPASSTTHISSRRRWKWTLVSCPGSTVITRTELGWFSAYVTTLPQGLSTIRGSSVGELLEQGRHLHARHRGVPTLVAVLAAGSVHRLLEGVGREHAEDDRDPGLRGGQADAVGRLLGDVVEVRGLAADHRAQADHGGVPTAGGQALRHERKLERPGDPREVEVVVPRALRAEALERSLDHLAHDDLVEARRDDREPAPPRLLEPAMLSHVVSPAAEGSNESRCPSFSCFV